MGRKLVSGRRRVDKNSICNDAESGGLDGLVWSRLLLLQYCGIPLILGRLTDSRTGPIGIRRWLDGWMDTAQLSALAV